MIVEVDILITDWESAQHSGRASDSGARGWVRNPPPPCCVLEQLYSQKVLVIPRKQWLSSDMTEKLLTGTLSLNTNKQTKSVTDLSVIEF